MAEIKGTNASEGLPGTTLADTIWGFGGNDLVTADAGDDRVFGGDGVIFTAELFDNDTLFGGNGNDTLFGEAGADRLFGEAGNDTLLGGPGADLLDGGNGVDTVDFNEQLVAINGAGVNASLTAGTATFGGVTDTLVSVENLIGTAASDTLVGNHAANVLTGNNGHDLLRGLGNTDTLLGGNGNDTLEGGAADDRLDGGAGIDTVSFVDLPDGLGALTIDLTAGQAVQLIPSPQVVPVLRVVDTLIGIENVRGSNFDDLIRGDAAANRLQGSNGGDQLLGGNGNDTLEGDGGIDAMEGGGGADRFVFRAGDTGVGFGNRDIVTDFEHLVDRIDLSAIDAVAGQTGNQDFTFIGAAPFTAEGQLRAFTVWLTSGPATIVQGNTSGAGGAEFEIQLSGFVTLTAADFV